MVDRRPSGQAANGKDTVISLQVGVAFPAGIEPTFKFTYENLTVITTEMDK